MKVKGDVLEDGWAAVAAGEGVGLEDLGHRWGWCVFKSLLQDLHVEHYACFFLLSSYLPVGIYNYRKL